jgi:hypothetical protein
MLDGGVGLWRAVAARRRAGGGVVVGDRRGSAAAACRLVRLCCRAGADLPYGAVLPAG